MGTAALLVVGGVAPAQAAERAAQPEGTTWTADLGAGEASGVTTSGGTVGLQGAGAYSAPREGGMTEGGAEPAGAVPTGLLTLAPQNLAVPTSRVSSAVDGDLPPGTSASVDVRGMRANGSWTEWIPAAPTDPRTGSVTLPEATREVQGRLVLTGTGTVAPTVRSVQLTAAPYRGTEGGADLGEALPFSANVFATREGLVGGTTSNGHVITDRDHFVALPSRRALSPRDTSDYSVRVCAPNGKCAIAPVWDVGPWNTRDDYWNPGPQRQNWGDLPQGVPQAQAAFRNGYNGGNDQFGRKLVNPAGIDLADGVFWDALGLKDNSQVQVDYLWTGSLTLSEVVTQGTLGIANIRSAPSMDAPIVGVAANSSKVPVQCRSGSWLQIGDKQFMRGAVLPKATNVAACPAP
ncbi:SH3 domain-containing protein [Pseudonocardia ailaonensis]